MGKAHLTVFDRALIENETRQSKIKDRTIFWHLWRVVFFCRSFLVNSATARTKSRLTWWWWCFACVSNSVVFGMDRLWEPCVRFFVFH